MIAIVLLIVGIAVGFVLGAATGKVGQGVADRRAEFYAWRAWWMEIVWRWKRQKLWRRRSHRRPRVRFWVHRRERAG